MKNIAAVIIDTYENKKMASVAIDMTLRLPFVKNVYTFSDTPFYGGAIFTRIGKIFSNNDYGNIIFSLLPNVVTEEHFLVIQWDGFPLIPENWQEQFLHYDYIGAPILWKELGDQDWVGNGGFSLRSQKLLEAIKKLGIQIDLNDPTDQPEDQLICRKFKMQLESFNVQFAPIEIASQFSFQAGKLSNEIFGFHSADNFPSFFPENELLGFADEILARMPQPLILLRFLENCLKTNKLDLFKFMVKDYEKKPNMLNAVNYERNNNPNGGFIKLIENIF